MKKKIETDEEFLKRMQKLVEQTAKSPTKQAPISSPAIDQMRAEGKKMGVVYAELEECDKIAEEFKKKPPLLITKHIAGIAVERYFADPEEERKVNLLKKHTTPFHTAIKDTSIFPIYFNTFGNAYLIRNGKKVMLPPSSSILPLIIKDGDILGTEEKSYITEIKNENQNEDNNYWHIFLFPNSELKISITEKVTNPQPAFMDPSQVSEAIKSGSANTVITHKIKSIELIKGLFNLNIKKVGRNINDLVTFASGFPRIEFLDSNSLMNKTINDSIVKMETDMNKDVLSKVMGVYGKLKAETSVVGKGDGVSSMIELNKDKSVVLFAIMSRVRSSGQTSGKLSSDPINPVKITIKGGTMYETDCSKNPDDRVRAVMKMWMGIASYIAVSKTQNEYSAKQEGRSMNLENAQKMVDYAKTLGDSEMEKLSQQMLKLAMDEDAREKSMAEIANNTEGQKREAEDMMKFAQDSGDKELIEVAKAQMNVASGNVPSFVAQIPNSEAILDATRNEFERVRGDVEVDLPPYSSVISADIVR